MGIALLSRVIGRVTVVTTFFRVLATLLNSTLKPQTLDP